MDSSGLLALSASPLLRRTAPGRTGMQLLLTELATVNSVPLPPQFSCSFTLSRSCALHQLPLPGIHIASIVSTFACSRRWTLFPLPETTHNTGKTPFRPTFRRRKGSTAPTHRVFSVSIAGQISLATSLIPTIENLISCLSPPTTRSEFTRLSSLSSFALLLTPVAPYNQPHQQLSEEYSHHHAKSRRQFLFIASLSINTSDPLPIRLRTSHPLDTIPLSFVLP